MSIDDLTLLIGFGLAATMAGACSRPAPTDPVIPSPAATAEPQSRDRWIGAMQTTASARLDYLARMSSDYYVTEFALPPDGRMPPHQFPDSTPEAPGHPSEVFCHEGAPRAFTPTQSTWQARTWQVLDFAPTGPLFHAFSIESSGTGAGARTIIRVRSDLDCNGKPEALEKELWIDRPTSSPP